MYKILEAVNPPALMKPHGYSHAYEVQGGKTLYIAGQVALDREGILVGPGDLAAQFRQVCENLRAAVGARGGQLTDIVKPGENWFSPSDIAVIDGDTARRDLAR